jgi:hypothetical protein
VASSLLFLVSGFLWGQTTTGIIVGLVTDSSGAVVPNAQVTITNIETHVSQPALTGSGGFYQSPNLPPGTYDISVEAKGFKRTTATAVPLQINQTARVDVTMELGKVTEQVQVTAAAPLLQTQTSSTGEVIGHHSIVDLPLNGRNYLDLSKLTPGVSDVNGPPGGSEIPAKVGAAWALTINGGRPENSDYLLDGTSARNHFVGTGNMLPSLDAIEEFKIKTNSSSAEFGFSVATVDVGLKSGTNGFHGSVFEFLRNNDLDSADFFTNRAGAEKTPLHRNQFGSSFGGPIKKNKVFFFGHYEGERQTSGRTALAQVFSLNDRAGDFSAPGNPTIIDWQTQQPFPGNKIPQADFSQFAKGTFQSLPLPNTSLPGGINYAAQVVDFQNADEGGLKMDIVGGERDTIMGHFLYANSIFSQHDIVPLDGELKPARTRSAGLTEIHTFGTNLVNEFRLGYNYGFVEHAQETTPDPIAQTLFGLINTDTRPEDRGYPVVLVSGGFAGLGDGFGFVPEGGKNHIFQFVDNITWVRGRHAMKGGFDIRKMRYRGINAALPRGAAIINGQYSGLPQSDLIQGLVEEGGGGSGDPVFYDLTTSFGAFLADDIRVFPNLTLNVGVRWEYYQPPVDVNNEGRQVFLDLFNTGDFLLVNKGQWRPGIWAPDKDNFAPRLGLAWRVQPRMSVRAAYGMFYNGMLPQGNELSSLHNNIPFRPVNLAVGGANTPIFASDIIQPPVPNDIALFPKEYPNPSLSPFVIDPSGVTPYVQQWNIGVEREFGPNLLIDLGYVGSHGIRLWGRGDPNQATQDVDLSNPTPIQSRRPFPWIGGTTYVRPGYQSWYNAFQAKVEKRYSKGFTFLGSFTWGMNLDEQSATNSIQTTEYNQRLDKGPSPNDSRLRLVMSGIYEIPVGKGMQFGSNFGPIPNALLGHWQLNMITKFQSGFAMDIQSSISSNQGEAWNRPNRVCDGNLPKSKRTIDRFIDTSCFVAQPFGAIGDAGRDPVTGPGINNWDLSIFKAFAALPNERLRVEIRGEFFNAWNHTQFVGGTMTLPSPSFGFITSDMPGREIQVGARLVF